MRTTTNLLNVILILLFISFLSCKEKPSENPKQDVIGKWESADHYSWIMEFTADKKLLSYKFDEDGLTVESEGDAAFVDDQYILSTWSVETEYYQIEVYANDLVLTSPKGKKLKFKRLNKSQ